MVYRCHLLSLEIFPILNTNGNYSAVISTFMLIHMQFVLGQYFGVVQSVSRSLAFSLFCYCEIMYKYIFILLLSIVIVIAFLFIVYFFIIGFLWAKLTGRVCLR